MNQQSSEKVGRPPPAESNDAGTECRRGRAEYNGVRTISDAGFWLQVALEGSPTAENRNQVALETNPDAESWNLTAFGLKKSRKSYQQTNEETIWQHSNR